MFWRIFLLLHFLLAHGLCSDSNCPKTTKIWLDMSLMTDLTCTHAAVNVTSPRDCSLTVCIYRKTDEMTDFQEHYCKEKIAVTGNKTTKIDLDLWNQWEIGHLERDNEGENFTYRAQIANSSVVLMSNEVRIKPPLFMDNYDSLGDESSLVLRTLVATPVKPLRYILFTVNQHDNFFYAIWTRWFEIHKPKEIHHEHWVLNNTSNNFTINEVKTCSRIKTKTQLHYHYEQGREVYTKETREMEIYSWNPRKLPVIDRETVKWVISGDRDLNLTWPAVKKTPETELCDYTFMVESSTRFQSTNTTWIQFKDLREHETVTVNIFVIAPDGEKGKSSGPILLGPTAPGSPSEVLKLQVESIGPTWANISWAKPSDPKGPIDYYIVHLLPSEKTVKTQDTFLKLTNLALCVEYRILVEAFNFPVKGFGGGSSTSKQMGFKLPLFVKVEDDFTISSIRSDDEMSAALKSRKRIAKIYEACDQFTQLKLTDPHIKKIVETNLVLLVFCFIILSIILIGVSSFLYMHYYRDHGQENQIPPQHRSITPVNNFQARTLFPNTTKWTTFPKPTTSVEHSSNPYYEDPEEDAYLDSVSLSDQYAE